MLLNSFVTSSQLHNYGNRGEQPGILDHTLVVQILRNLLFSVKVRKFGVLCQRRLLVHEAFLALRKRCYSFN